jgi:hypothetical protein
MGMQCGHCGLYWYPVVYLYCTVSPRPNPKKTEVGSSAFKIMLHQVIHSSALRGAVAPNVSKKPCSNTNRQRENPARCSVQPEIYYYKYTAPVLQSNYQQYYKCEHSNGDLLHYDTALIYYSNNTDSTISQ